MAHGFACHFFGAFFFTSGDGVEAEEFFDAELSKLLFCVVDVAVADGNVFLWFAAVGDFAEVGFSAMQGCSFIKKKMPTVSL